MNHIKYSRQVPPPNLDQFIESFSYFENSNELPYHYTILPDGLCDIILFFDVQNKILDIQLYGIWNKEIDVDVPALNNVVVISMYPLAAEYLLNSSISNFFNTYQSITNFDKIILHNISYSFDNVIDIFINHFNGKLIRIDSRKIELFHIIRQTKGQIMIEEIENIIFWTQRQMHRYFSEWMGVSLKSYLNIIRCAQTYNLVKQGEFYPSLDFTDQSHFIKELKKHTGSTPKQLFAKFNNETQGFSVL